MKAGANDRRMSDTLEAIAEYFQSECGLTIIRVQDEWFLIRIPGLLDCLSFQMISDSKLHICNICISENLCHQDYDLTEFSSLQKRIKWERNLELVNQDEFKQVFELVLKTVGIN